MKIPDGWTSYKAIGETVEGTRFIAFKVPLKEACVKRNLPPKEWFTPQSLISEIKDQGKELGLVIDLTNTTKYYNKQDFTSQSIEYEKIFTEGRVVPSTQVCDRFKDVVNKFLDSNPDNESLIGVHCTHGLNRTGYIVCRYLIDCLNKEPNCAIEAFNKARGHSIERENYLKYLKFGPNEASSRADSEEINERLFHTDNRTLYPRETWQEDQKFHNERHRNNHCRYKSHLSEDRQNGKNYRERSRPAPYQWNPPNSHGYSIEYENYYNPDMSNSSLMYSDRQYEQAGWFSSSRGRSNHQPYHSYPNNTNRSQHRHSDEQRYNDIGQHDSRH